LSTSYRRHSRLWQKFARSKKYREEFVAAQLRQGLPFQIRALMKQHGLSQDALAAASGVDQATISRAIDPEYGRLNLATLVKIAAGFDVAFIAQFVPFSQLDNWISNLREDSVQAASFSQENEAEDPPGLEARPAAIGVPDNALSRKPVSPEISSAAGNNTGAQQIAASREYLRQQIGGR
jgi:transcriptional regulator with XRE-family HTH domain